ncbi:glycosyltransferase family 2 protein [Dyella sp. BiH032]|uniref:glycosyltransferase family 2 protein n=1 Tax=Dyella sp. BiH032 TaxID=3075430 RepID=UPI0028931567|nr:glycosyltransferase family 2 protein [Dyella sp. BiH032]WNL44706.1 glycosyltransferase family 2 protein [Dyella sp. BiH032]
MPVSLPRWCIVIPCHNEERAIGGVLADASRLGVPVYVVDDGSTDATPKIIARHHGVTLLRHDERRGKGEALRTGLRAARKAGFEAVLTMDGDGQHQVADVPYMLAAARRHPGALVIGARLLDTERQPRARHLANRVADWGISWACARGIADTQSGQRWYPASVMALADTATNGFAYEASLLIRACRELGTDVVSVPIPARYGAQFRRSYFRPLLDVARITWSTSSHLLRHGHLRESYRLAKERLPCVEHHRVHMHMEDGPLSADLRAGHG